MTYARTYQYDFSYDQNKNVDIVLCSATITTISRKEKKCKQCPTPTTYDVKIPGGGCQTYIVPTSIYYLKQRGQM